MKDNSKTETVMDGYTIKPIRKGFWKIKSPKKVVYRLKILQGVLICTCPSYKYRSNCKHLAMAHHVGAKRNIRMKRESVLQKINEFIPLLNKGWTQHKLCGELRRKTPLVKDVVVVIEGGYEKTIALLEAGKIPYLTEDEDSKEGFKYVKLFWKRVSVNFVFTSKRYFHTAVFYYTGPQSFVKLVKAKAKQKGYILSLRGLRKKDAKNPSRLANEAAIFDRLNFPKVLPVKREAYAEAQV